MSITSKVAALVKAGTVRYFLLNGGGFGGPGGGDGTQSASTWIQSSCTAVPASKYSSSSATGFGDRGGALYDCAGVK